MCEEVRKRMTSKEFATLVSNNCSVVGTIPSDDEKKMYQELRDQDLKDGIPVIEVDKRNMLQKVWDLVRDFIFEFDD
jgi:UDP-N-acetyl-D-mannosaminuronic acid transferase (WecB/TagA/CpsF family)